jgi:hypothetical protein
MTSEQLDMALDTAGDIEEQGLGLPKPPAQYFIATDGQRRVAVDSEGYEYWRYVGIIIPEATGLIKLAQMMLNDNPDIKYIAIEEDGDFMAGYDSRGEMLDGIEIEEDYSFGG